MALIKMMRIRHWMKNLLVLFPLVFFGGIFDPTYSLSAAAAFFGFSFGSSAVYIVNDIRDVEADRNHPRKKNRPIASGKVSTSAAWFVCIACLAIALSLTLAFSANVWMASIVLGVYLLANVAYSLGLKNVPVVDIAILASGFVFRVLFGGAVCGIPISSWLLLTILALSVFFALGKRRGELLRHGASMRKSLEAYSVSFLDKNLYVYLGIGLVFYSLWTFERIGGFDTIIDVRSVVFILGIPLVMMMSLRYSLEIESSDSDGDPIEVILGDTSDRSLLILAVVWCIVMFAGLYLL